MKGGRRTSECCKVIKLKSPSGEFLKFLRNMQKFTLHCRCPQMCKSVDIYRLVQRLLCLSSVQPRTRYIESKKESQKNKSTTTKLSKMFICVSGMDFNMSVISRLGNFTLVTIFFEKQKLMLKYFKNYFSNPQQIMLQILVKTSVFVDFFRKNS